MPGGPGRTTAETEARVPESRRSRGAAAGVPGYSRGGSSLLMSCFYHTRTLSMTPWPPRPRHEEAGTNALISLSVMPISMSSKTQVRRVAFVKSFVEEDEPSAVLMM